MSCPHPKACARLARGCTSPDTCDLARKCMSEPADFDASPDPKNRTERRAKKAALRHAKKQGRKAR